MAKEFLKTHDASFSNRPRTIANTFVTYNSSDFALAPYGPYWKFMKKILMSELLSVTTLGQHLPIRREEIRFFLQLVLKKAEAGESVNVGIELMRVSNNIITRMIMGKRCCGNEDEAGQVKMMVYEMNDVTGKYNMADYIWFCKYFDFQGFRKRLEVAHGKYDEMMERIIGQHEEVRRKRKEMGGDGGDTTTKDVLDLLLDIVEDEEAEIKLTKENIKGFILNIFGGATDTSSLTIKWALSELINHPKIMERARQEIDSVIGKDRLVEESDAANLPYLYAIIKETLRLHPVGPLIIRECSESCTISGYEIPAKTRLYLNLWAIGRDPKHWENPLEFRPERFICEEGSGKSPLDIRGQDFHYMPFGNGRRGCPGTSLALKVVQTGLASIIQCFEWKLTDKGSDTVDMEEGPGATLRKAHSLVVLPVARLNPFPPIF
ncbi:hypothetical protein L1049_007841 [Liquidambar formosana]|uniref:Flavone synthase II n=1 Tax=Liquidambar formosana TaxID=63359 RepID=A0AAP0S2K2_LIQFO